MALIDLQRDAIGMNELKDSFAQTQEVLVRMAQYSQPIRGVQMVCNHPQQIIVPQRQITDLQTKQFLPTQCNHTELEQRMQTLTKALDTARWRPAAPGSDEDHRQQLVDMSQDALQSGEEACSLRTQLGNAVTLAARATTVAPHAPEDKGEKCPDSPDISGVDRTQLRCWTAQLWMVIQQKPARFPHKQSKMKYSFNHLRGIAIGQILPHALEDGTIGLEDLPVFI